MSYPQQAPYPPQPMPYAPPPTTRFGALAWTALILGIVGVVGSPVLFLNNLTAVVAFVGLVLGIIALFGSKKILAAIGVVLCVAGVAITVAVQVKAVQELDAIISGTTNNGQVSAGGVDQPAAAQAQPGEVPTWGKRYTWQDGLAVDVAAPEACTPGPYAAPQGVVRAVKFTIVVTNGTDKPFETAVLSVGTDAQFNGKKAESVFDSNGGCEGSGFDSTTVLPGKTFTFSQVYSVGAEPGEMQLVLQPTFMSDKAVFTGQA